MANDCRRLQTITDDYRRLRPRRSSSRSTSCCYSTPGTRCTTGPPRASAATSGRWASHATPPCCSRQSRADLELISSRARPPACRSLGGAEEAERLDVGQGVSRVDGCGGWVAVVWGGGGSVWRWCGWAWCRGAAGGRVENTGHEAMRRRQDTGGRRQRLLEHLARARRRSLCLQIRICVCACPPAAARVQAPPDGRTRTGSSK